MELTQSAELLANRMPKMIDVFGLVYGEPDGMAAEAIDAFAVAVTRVRAQTVLIAVAPPPALEQLLSPSGGEEAEAPDRPYVYLKARPGKVNLEKIADLLAFLRAAGGTAILAAGSEFWSTQGLGDLVQGVVRLGDAAVPESLSVPVFGTIPFKGVTVVDDPAPDKEEHAPSATQDDRTPDHQEQTPPSGSDHAEAVAQETAARQPRYEEPEREEREPEEPEKPATQEPDTHQPDTPQADTQRPDSEHQDHEPPDAPQLDATAAEEEEFSEPVPAFSLDERQAETADELVQEDAGGSHPIGRRLLGVLGLAAMLTLIGAWTVLSSMSGGGTLLLSDAGVFADLQARTAEGLGGGPAGPTDDPTEAQPLSEDPPPSEGQRPSPGQPMDVADQAPPENPPAGGGDAEMVTPDNMQQPPEETPADPDTEGIIAFELMERRPFSVLVGSFAEADRAQRVADRARDVTGLAFLAPTEVLGVEYLRVLAGALETEIQSQDLMEVLVTQGVIEDNRRWQIRSTPFAFDMGVFSDLEAAQARSSALEQRGVPTYLFAADSFGGEVYRVYAGAYEDEASTSPLVELLATAGEAATLVVRRGRPLSAVRP